MTQAACARRESGLSKHSPGGSAQPAGLPETANLIQADASPIKTPSALNIDAMSTEPQHHHQQMGPGRDGQDVENFARGTTILASSPGAMPAPPISTGCCNPGALYSQRATEHRWLLLAIIPLDKLAAWQLWQIPKRQRPGFKAANNNRYLLRGCPTVKCVPSQPQGSPGAPSPAPEPAPAAAADGTPAVHPHCH